MPSIAGQILIHGTEGYLGGGHEPYGTCIQPTRRKRLVNRAVVVRSALKMPVHPLYFGGGARRYHRNLRRKEHLLRHFPGHHSIVAVHRDAHASEFIFPFVEPRVEAPSPRAVAAVENVPEVVERVVIRVCHSRDVPFPYRRIILRFHSLVLPVHEKAHARRSLEPFIGDAVAVESAAAALPSRPSGRIRSVHAGREQVSVSEGARYLVRRSLHVQVHYSTYGGGHVELVFKEAIHHVAVHQFVRFPSKPVGKLELRHRLCAPDHADIFNRAVGFVHLAQHAEYPGGVGVKREVIKRPFEIENWIPARQDIAIVQRRQLRRHERKRLHMLGGVPPSPVDAHRKDWTHFVEVVRIRHDYVARVHAAFAKFLPYLLLRNVCGLIYVYRHVPYCRKRSDPQRLLV